MGDSDSNQIDIESLGVFFTSWCYLWMCSTSPGRPRHYGQTYENPGRCSDYRIDWKLPTFSAIWLGPPLQYGSRCFYLNILNQSTSEWYSVRSHLTRKPPGRDPFRSMNHRCSRGALAISSLISGWKYSSKLSLRNPWRLCSITLSIYKLHWANINMLYNVFCSITLSKYKFNWANNWKNYSNHEKCTCNPLAYPLNKTLKPLIAERCKAWGWP